MTTLDKKLFEKLYKKYNRREFVHPDPLEFLYDYKDVRDREIVALVASSLAYGRVRQILRSTVTILTRMTPFPSAYLKKSTSSEIQKAFKGFKHRFTTGEDMSCLLVGMKSAIERHGSLEKCFLAGLRDGHENVLEALSLFVFNLRSYSKTSFYCSSEVENPRYFLDSPDSPETQGGLARKINFIPSPKDGSACKRLNLFLRWMVRKDEVDPGGWKKVPASKLIVPLDTHMHRIARELGLTNRKQANLKTALEITDAFRKFAPEDPVKYDFVLTRFGIHDQLRKISLKSATEDTENIEFKKFNNSLCTL